MLRVREEDMSMDNLPTALGAEIADPLAVKIRESILGVESLRAENSDEVTRSGKSSA
jgi:hypothetical protein